MHAALSTTRVLLAAVILTVVAACASEPEPTGSPYLLVFAGAADTTASDFLAVFDL